MREILFNVIMGGLAIFIVFFIAKKMLKALLIFGLLAALCASVVCAYAMGEDMFHVMRLFAYGIFLHFSLILVGFVIFLWKTLRLIATLCLVLLISIVGVGAYGFLIEPTMLEVNRYQIQSKKIDKPIKIAIVADIQTDKIREYDREALQKIILEKPDLILLAGDYIQLEDRALYKEECAKLKNLFKETNFTAPMGIYAVAGNVDNPGWLEIFSDTKIIATEETQKFELKDLQITALSLGNSFNPALKVDGADKFHIVVGHSPDFALGDVSADLLVAGHTHGGQICVPFYGPIITLSQVPKSWASGFNEIKPGKHLIVSRGIGMERGNAPRVRFLCRPEIVIVEVIPAGK